MVMALYVTVFVIAFCLLACYRAGLKLFTFVSALLLLIGSYFNLISHSTWIIFTLLAISLNINTFRKHWFSRAALKLYKRKAPKMSKTEIQAIDAGTLWWEAELFKGKPNWDKMLDIPISRLSVEEYAFLEGAVNSLCRQINDFHLTHELADLPDEIWTRLKEDKFFAMNISKEYGGLGFSAHAQSLVLQKLSSVSGLLSSIVGVPNSLGPAELLQQYGTQAQKNYYLPRLAQGIEIPCFALTSPEAGSDASAIPDKGIVTQGLWQGEEILGIELTWNKRYITLAPIATVLGLAFKLLDPKGLLGEKENLGITCALVPTELEGIEIGRRHFPLNVPFQNGPTRGTNVFIPLDFIIGGAKMAGEGWRMLMECLSIGRGITLPSNTTGASKSAALAVGAYSRIRHQFKMPIGEMEGIEEPLARLAGNAYMMDSACALTISGIDMGEKPAIISAIVKYHCTHKHQQNMIDAMDILGGKGICLGPNNFIARGYQAAPIAVTVEGANILTRSMIIFGQGAIRCHPFVLAELQAAFHQDPKQSLSMFDNAFFGHMGFVLSNLVRSFGLGLTDGRASKAPTNNKRYYQQINRYCANLALLSDVSMAMLGSKLKRKERLSARLSDLLSQLYLSSSVLKRYEDDGAVKEDLPLVHWCLQDSLAQAEKAIDDFLHNFPHRKLGILLRFILFPFGLKRKAPSDILDSQVAKITQNPSDTRARLGRHIFLEASPHHPAGKMEQALKSVIAAEPLHQKVCVAVAKDLPFMFLHISAEIGLKKGVLSKAQAEVLIQAEQDRLASISVDDFAFNALAAGSHEAYQEKQAHKDSII